MHAYYTVLLPSGVFNMCARTEFPNIHCLNIMTKINDNRYNNNKNVIYVYIVLKHVKAEPLWCSIGIMYAWIL